MNKCQENLLTMQQISPKKILKIVRNMKRDESNVSWKCVRVFLLKFFVNMAKYFKIAKKLKIFETNIAIPCPPMTCCVSFLLLHRYEP